jgi:hypothetical protein
MSVEGEIAGFVLAVVCASICIMRSGIVLCFFGSFVAAFYSFNVAFNVAFIVSFCLLFINDYFRRSFSRLSGLSIAFRLSRACLLRLLRL